MLALIEQLKSIVNARTAFDAIFLSTCLDETSFIHCTTFEQWEIVRTRYADLFLISFDGESEYDPFADVGVIDNVFVER